MDQIFGELRSLFAAPYIPSDSRAALLTLLVAALEKHGASYFERVIFPYCEDLLKTWPDHLGVWVDKDKDSLPNPLHLLYKRGNISLRDDQILDPYLCRLQEIRFSATSPKAIVSALEGVDEGCIKSLGLTLPNCQTLPSLMQSASLTHLKHLDLFLEEMTDFGEIARVKTPITSLILSVSFPTRTDGLNFAISSFLPQLKYLQLWVEEAHPMGGAFNALAYAGPLSLEHLTLGGKTISMKALALLMEQTPTLKTLTLTEQETTDLLFFLSLSNLHQLDRLTFNCYDRSLKRADFIQAFRTSSLKSNLKSLALMNMHLRHEDILTLLGGGSWEKLECLSLLGNGAWDSAWTFRENGKIPQILNVLGTLVNEGNLPHLTNVDLRYNGLGVYIPDELVKDALKFYPKLASVNFLF